MKKILLMLVVVFFLAGANAMADTDTDIVFYGIPWGISMGELEEHLKDRDVPTSALVTNLDDSMPIWIYRFRNDYQYEIEGTGHNIHVNLRDDAVKIAGYPVQMMDFYAHYDISDGVLNMDPAASYYYMAKLWLDVNDEKAVAIYDDLFRKLTGLYGEGATATSEEVDTTYTYTVWHGANSTAVCLFRSESSSSDRQFVHLYYGITDCEPTLLDVRQLVIRHDIEAVYDDTTGL